MRFLFDAHHPLVLARAIATLAEDEPYEVKHIIEKFGHGAKDTDWIPTLGMEGGWVLISEDRRIRTRPLERCAFEHTGLIGFFLAKGWNQLSLWPRAALMVTWWPHIVTRATTATSGEMLVVPHTQRPQEIKTWRAHASKRKRRRNR